MDEVTKVLENHLIGHMIQNLVEEDKLEDFISFARVKAKEDGMDTKELTDFFDSLEEQFCDNIDWNKLFDIVNEVTNNRKVMGFKQDKCIIIENKTLSDAEVEDYMDSETAPINLNNLNKALETISVKLDFIEAIDNPFDVGGFRNFVRFRVVELDK